MHEMLNKNICMENEFDQRTGAFELIARTKAHGI
jgi:hypothetical protein